MAEIETMLHTKNEAQFLCFLVDEDEPGAQLYGINVFKIREVIYQEDPLTLTEGLENSIILGSLTIRNEIIPIIDVGRWLHYNSQEIERDLRPFSINVPKSLVVVCSFSRCTVGLKIAHVKHIIQRNWEQVQAGSENGIKEDDKIIATTRYDDDSIVHILDAEKMLYNAFSLFNERNEFQMQGLKTIRSNKLILIAEDSKSATKSLEIILERMGLKCICFGNGDLLLQYLKNCEFPESIGAVITDLEMPVTSGFEVLKQIKNSEVFHALPVIVNSSMHNDANVDAARDFGAFAFITKSEPSEIYKYLHLILEES
ncbi:chemotaxis protein CheW [Helicobacter mustelae]|uniref:Putative chemotaxis protein CheV2 similar to H. pylori CheV2/HP0616 n=1 Tax=Helicobacter mustelae (strain ATCC 43772 / CCUG 25715 / CIP 103759 / LMG 18044 / NCTC 12198 / R85-136P) TaxID=679897 RepID=D3UHB3_HELM1|nr:chemotaxis protein CheW [Helicobacter mustelae]CBG39885.1 putative chemotaxis protein CheV2 similar to H. pylori CheV2/HP0616 [Helicobacter mustelae 12198]SQH71395.1 chemotaxis protein CheV [Helicobacter mustelae]